jgi:hypothetical protein
MSEENSGLLDYLGELREAIGGFSVVAQRVEEQRVSDEYTWEELPIAEVTVDEDEGHICLVRPDKELAGGAGLNVESFFDALRTKLEQHPDFTIVVSVWFQADEEHTAGVDMPLDSVEVDEDVGVLRLRF